MELSRIVKEINNEFFKSSMSIGKIVTHPDGYKVKIVDGQLYDSVYGRLSNWWSWRKVLPNGKFGKLVHGYGW